jgi:hypothetical protein
MLRVGFKGEDMDGIARAARGADALHLASYDAGPSHPSPGQQISMADGPGEASLL